MKQLEDIYKELEQYLRRTRDIPLVLDFDINDIFPIHLDTCKIKW